MSTTPKPQPDAPVFFLDRTHGRKILPDLLRKVGMTIEVHADIFKQEEADPVWIAECGSKQWAIITGDKRLERVLYNREAVLKSKAKVFILTDTNSKCEEWAAAIIVGRRKLIRLVQSHEGPFYATIGKVTETHVSDIRLLLEAKPEMRRRRRKPARKKRASKVSLTKKRIQSQQETFDWKSV